MAHPNRYSFYYCHPLSISLHVLPAKDVLSDEWHSGSLHRSTFLRHRVRRSVVTPQLPLVYLYKMDFCPFPLFQCNLKTCRTTRRRQEQWLTEKSRNWFNSNSYWDIIPVEQWSKTRLTVKQSSVARSNNEDEQYQCIFKEDNKLNSRQEAGVSFVGAVLVRGFKEGACSFIPLSLLASKIWVTHELLM
ncbi:hypothetical protein B0H13DRAFT_1853723 [Mycena leptocephala]|nr:hypothetical protein B0H13DRAFT_1853723 [Mycena leptocephala]